jgi:hypothetical protein
MDEWLAGEQKRAVLRNVAAYRELCERVRRGSTGGLIFGAIMLAIWYFAIPEREKFRVFGLIYLGLSALEFTAALWNKFRPSAEGVLIDGVVLLVFGAATLLRQYLIWQGQMPGRVFPLLLVFGAYMLYSGFSHVRNYAQLRRAFAQRPTADHLRWFDELLREVRRADPAEDPTALDLPTRPPVRGKLLGDTAIFLQAGSDDVVIAARDDVEIEREPAKEPDRDPVGFLLIEGADLGGFPLDPANWRNYAAWKTEGGQPPPPIGTRAAADPDLE